MNNTFIEGPIQTGKSTLIRTVLTEMFGQELEGVAGFTSQRVFSSDAPFDIQSGQLVGFRLAPVNADLNIIGNPSSLDNVFKYFTPGGAHVDMSVFETAGVDYMENALVSAKAGHTKLILLDEIGGHELKSEQFRHKLYELLDSDVPCAGVIKSPENTRRMDPQLLQLNAELHERVNVVPREKFRNILLSII